MAQAIYLITTGAREAAFRNIKTIAECLADELINAAKGSSNSFAIKKKDELERVAKVRPSCLTQCDRSLTRYDMCLTPQLFEAIYFLCNESKSNQLPVSPPSKKDELELVAKVHPFCLTQLAQCLT